MRICIQIQLFTIHEPGSLTNADPDTGQTLPSLKVEFLHEKDTLVRGMDPRIQIRTKMSGIRNTAYGIS